MCVSLVEVLIGQAVNDTHRWFFPPSCRCLAGPPSRQGGEAQAVGSNAFAQCGQRCTGEDTVCDTFPGLLYFLGLSLAREPPAPYLFKEWGVSSFK